MNNDDLYLEQFIIKDTIRSLTYQTDIKPMKYFLRLNKLE